MTRAAPPSGAAPPRAFEFADGTVIDLGPLALELCTRYYDVYPDDLERYGEPGRAWCEHDSRYLLAWALEDGRAGAVNCVEQVQWLARVLVARAFPIERLARHVELTAAILRAPRLGDVGIRASERMTEAASTLI
jgi:hypothetical protein